MKIEAIKTEQDYEEALKRLEEIFDSKVGSKEGKEMEVLAALIEEYENEHYPIDPN
jgi:HTH-type transcriptional regulator/antitoxin HigA